MASVVVDSSAWIEYLRNTTHPASHAVRTLLIRRRAASFPIIEMELLRGVKPAQKSSLGHLMAVVPSLPLDRDDFQMAGDMMNRLLSKGITVPPLDGLIASACLRRDLEILTLDRHFELVPGMKRHPLR